MTTTRRTLHVLLAALLVAPGATPQQAPGKSDQPLVFRASSNLIIVNVSVRDKSGKPIDHLKGEDFQILEDGKPQAISVFEVQHLNDEKLPELPPPPKPVKGSIKAPLPGEALEAGGGPMEIKRYRDKRLMVMFFDFTGMQPADQIRAQAAGIKWLREQMTESDLVSIMTFTNDLKTVEEFTNDREKLIATVNTFLPGQLAELSNADSDTSDDSDDGSYTADETEFNIFNTDRKLGALETAVKKLGALPEKKALVYFSSGISKTGVENQSQLRSTVNAAVRANVSFYPVDARGLVAQAPAGDASSASPRGSGVFQGSTQTRMRDSFNDQQETLTTLAADTGGKALLDSNDLTLGMKQAQKDIDTYYILGYYTTNENQDGRYRRIKVVLNRPQLQAKLDYRSGYFASKVWKKFDGTERERQLEEALGAGDPVTDIPLALEVNYFRLKRDSYFLPVTVKLPGSSIPVVHKGSSDTTELDFLGQVRDSKGRSVGLVRDTIKVKLPATEEARKAQRSLQYDTGFTLPPGTYTVRFLARENQEGRMGTFETKFTVPDLTSNQPSLKVSSVVWSAQREPLSAAVGAASKDKKTLAMHPLVQDNQKLIPSVTRVFRKDQNLYVYLEVYDPATDQASGSLSVAATVALYRGKMKAYETAPVRVNQSAGARRGTVPLQFQLALNRMTPGRYTCQVNVVDELGRRFAFPRTPLVLLPEAAGVAPAAPTAR